MFKPDSIPTLVYHLEKRHVYLYHACQFQDFCSYLELGGIPSRKLLEHHNLQMTPFTTDGIDRANGVWDKIFLNLEDFGRIFAKGKAGVPTVYGPILFRFEPAALLNAVDVAICLRSAGAQGFNRERESLKHVSDVDNLFFYMENRLNVTAALKSRAELQRTFGPNAQSVEISCTIPDEMLPYGGLIDIVVDPYIIDEIELSNHVLAQMKSADYDFAIKKRPVTVPSYSYQSFLIEGEHFPSPADLARSLKSAHFSVWAEKIEAKGGLLLKNYYRFLQYLQVGTYLPVKAQKRTAETSEWAYYPIQVAEEFSNGEFLDDDLDEEFELILEEMDDDQENWARLSEDGWFYPDDDEDEIAADDLTLIG